LLKDQARFLLKHIKINLSFNCKIIFLAGPFIVSAEQHSSGEWTWNNTFINFSKFPLFNTSNCKNESLLIWNPAEADCDWPCGKIKCHNKEEKHYGLCIQKPCESK
jgi:hypothetical protein